MSTIIDRLKTKFITEDDRYAYADSVTNTFLAGQLRALREARSLTQNELAELVGTQQSGISRWLNSGFAKCKVETLRKFAKAFGVHLHISFEEFGTLPTDIQGFTKERLAPRKFEDDPVFFPRQGVDEQTVANSKLEQALSAYGKTIVYEGYSEQLLEACRMLWGVSRNTEQAIEPLPGGAAARVVKVPASPVSSPEMPQMEVQSPPPESIPPRQPERYRGLRLIKSPFGMADNSPEGAIQRKTGTRGF